MGNCRETHQGIITAILKIPQEIQKLKEVFPHKCNTSKYHNIQWRPKLLEHLTYLKSQNIFCLQRDDHDAQNTANIRLSEWFCFYLLIFLIFGISTFCKVWSYFPESFNTNVIPCLLQLKPMTFLWLDNRLSSLYSYSCPNFHPWFQCSTIPIMYRWRLVTKVII